MRRRSSVTHRQRVVEVARAHGDAAVGGARAGRLERAAGKGGGEGVAEEGVAARRFHRARCCDGASRVGDGGVQAVVVFRLNLARGGAAAATHSASSQRSSSSGSGSGCEQQHHTPARCHEERA